MRRRPDYVIAGAGLTGATIARLLHDAGRSVLVLERRDAVGGNVSDFTHPSGIRVHRHGPHYFRTSSRRIWSFVRRFAEFERYEARVLSRVNGHLEQWPVSGSCIRRLAPGFAPRRRPGGANFVDVAHAILPPAAFDLFIREYSEKQWGMPAESLTASLAKRIRVNWDDDPRLTPRARFQAVPRRGYTALVTRMLEGIPVECDADFLANRSILRGRRGTVYTGAIDEYFGFTLGRLGYRSQRRELYFDPDADRLLPAAQVNEARHAAGPHIRTIEWKQIGSPAQGVRGSVLTRETPYTPEGTEGLEYPCPDRVNAERYAAYRALADQESGVLICGRLGEYRYLDMDQAIARAWRWAEALLESAKPK